jgi:hypothetical protein
MARTLCGEDLSRYLLPRFLLSLHFQQVVLVPTSWEIPPESLSPMEVSLVIRQA